MANLDYVKRLNIPSIGDIPIKEGTGTFRPSSVQREDHDAEQPEDSGYTEKNVKAECKVTVLSDPRISVEDLNFRDENITIGLRSGKEYMMPAASAAEAAELSKGEIPLTIRSAISERTS